MTGKDQINLAVDWVAHAIARFGYALGGAYCDNDDHSEIERIKEALETLTRAELPDVSN